MFDNTVLIFGISCTVVGLIVAWCLALLALPGNWLMIAIAATHAYLTPDDSRWDIGWPIIAVMVVLAALGELAEAAFAAAGVKRLGGSRRGMLLAVVGSFAGALVGAGVGVPIPVLGSLIGVVLGAGLGALGGAAVGELWKGRTFDQSLQIGHAAFWGRLLGSMAKLIASSMMLAMALGALVLK